jgi:hypothetical protein
MTRRRSLLIFVAMLTLSVSGCGLKTLPIPPQEALPQAINDLKFQQDENKIVLNWTAPKYTTVGSKLPNIDAFEILRAVVPEKDYCPGCPIPFTSSIEIKAETAIADPEKQTAQYTEMVLRPGHRFFYKVRTIAGWRLISEDSNIVSFSWNSPASAPQNLTAIPGDREIILSWLPVTSLIDGQPLDAPLYQVYRGKSENNYSPLDPLVSEPTFTDFGLVNGQKYFYKISAVQLQGETKITGLASHAVSATPVDMTAPAPPRNIQVVQLANGVKILWDKGAERDIAGYKIYRRAATKKTMVEIGRVNHANFSFTDQPPVENTGWYYAVTAFDQAAPANESAPSKEIFYESF